ncbi:hypothetical protein [Myxococcus sp. Y35]|uniref:hypothetical protein n=1 Tax=Pseudomyxococcus flavus TaxID=3115648 RepID=UPI003CE8B1CE
MARYLDQMNGSMEPLNALWRLEAEQATPRQELSAEEAPAVFQEVVQVLSGTPSAEQLRKAQLDLVAACRAELPEACTYMREQLKRPKRLSGATPSLTRSAFEKKAVAAVVIGARLGTNGRPRDFTVVESAPFGMTEEVIKALSTFIYEPAKLAGHPIEIPYTFTFRIFHPEVSLSKEQELQWARTRVSQFPASSAAWDNLARILARDAPEDPWYGKALDSLNRLSPQYWWSATELAWLRAEEGRYAEAEPLAKVGRRSAPENPYVLETAARVAFHRGRCREAIEEQQLAVTKLPEAWPEEERARFKQALEVYQRGCSSASAPAVPSNG